MISFLLQLFILIGALFFGGRLRGIGLGVVSCVALVCLYLFFGVEPQEPPYFVLLIMMAALVAASTLEAAGSLDLLTHEAGRLFSRYPKYLIWLSPLVSYFTTFFIGTSHIIYLFLPVIVRVAQREGIRAEGPLVASVVASQQAIIASPVSAATAIMVKELAFPSGTLLALFLPSTLVGTLLAAGVADRCSSSFAKPRRALFPSTALQAPFQAKPFASVALMLFFSGILTIVLLKLCSPSYYAKNIYITPLILFVVAGLILIYIGGQDIARGRIFPMGMQAVITLLGVTWLSKSFLVAHLPTMKMWVGRYMHRPWQWLPLLFGTTLLTNSQSSTMQTLSPLAVQILGAAALLPLLPAANSFYFFPTYPTLLAAVVLDKTGSTGIGRYLLNHSFMLPGLAGTFGTCATASLLHYLFLS